jgi:tetratricopeptide (TPR) repeat protein
MAALAWNFIIEQMKGYLKLVPIVVVVALMLLPIKFMAKNHPYEALYFNEWFGGINAAYTNYETDYWMNSSKEAFDWLVVNEKIKERAAAHDTFSIRTNCVDPLSYYKKKTFGDVKNGGCGYVNYKNRMNMDDWDYGIFYSRFLEKQDLETPGYYPPLSAIHVIRVDTVPVMVIIKRNARLEKKYLAIAANYMNLNHPDSALIYCNKTLAIYSENPKAISLAAQINLQLKNFDAVINLVGPAIAANPGNLELFYFLGLAYLNKGDKANAKNYLEYVSKMNPGNPQLDQLLKQL